MDLLENNYYKLKDINTDDVKTTITTGVIDYVSSDNLKHYDSLIKDYIHKEITKAITQQQEQKIKPKFTIILGDYEDFS